MVFTNLTMTTHVNGTAYWPLMNSMVVGRYKSANVTNMKGGYQKPYVVTTLIFDHIYGDYVRPNKVTL